ncbi:MAG: Lrp/AsnC family transcriptional regulator [Hydrogenophaga sp.]|uniref:Lrp/AsnC family transcriptional regulator n=1 Tax=Hydrogenophaga sp. TaxID=1904254 RepID=UPI001D9D04E3|nr:Lrp/AsnC family transcriptional regulator [Hydrogenophaga sp.]MBX3611614.1 Lrp/AsnC family transcriptional regulator [Hydrogenophaga sp.]
MDQIDREIVRLLAQDGRISFRDLGEAVHLSANAVAERFRRLCGSGVVQHIRATVDPSALGRDLHAQIEVKMAPGTSAMDFETALRHLPQVLGATLMTGSFDYAVRVACADRDDLMQLTETLRQHPGVRETYTRLILREVALPPSL